MSARAALAAAAALLMTGTSLRAAAQAPAEAHADSPSSPIVPVHVALVGHPGCRDAEFFLQQILARTPRARRAEAGEAGRSFSVRVQQSEPHSTGRLVIRDGAGTESAREVTAATCDEVIAALALVAALTIDPHAVTTPVPAPPPTPPKTEPPLAAASPAPAARPAASARAAPAPSESAAAPRPPAARDPGAEARAQGALRLGARAAVEVMRGIAPELVILPRAMIELELEPAGDSLFAPAARLSAAHGEGSGSVEGVGRASFAWTGARIELCPLRAGKAVGAYLRPCLGADVARLRASGHDLPERRQKLRPWVAPLLTVRAGFRLPMGLTAEIYAGGSFPLVDDRFEFHDRRNENRVVAVHEVPFMSFMAGVAAGLTGDVP